MLLGRLLNHLLHGLGLQGGGVDLVHAAAGGAHGGPTVQGCLLLSLLLHCQELLYPGQDGQGLLLLAEDLLDELDASQASEQLLLTEE